MQTNKKFIISLTAVAVVAVAAIVSLVVVLAAFTVTTTNQFSVSYSAAGVEATITASYKKAALSTGEGTYTTIKSGTADNITFTRQETGGTSNSTVTKSFDNLSNVSITKDQFFVIKYTIKNDSTGTPMTVALSVPGTPTNFSKSFIYTTSATDPTAKAYASITDGTASFATKTIAAGATGYIYVIFAIANTDVDASFSGTSTWTLNAA